MPVGMKRRVSGCSRAGLAIAVGVLAIIALMASTFNPAYAELLSVGVDEAKLKKLPGPAATVIIGNPLIADVSVQDSSLLVVTGKNYGTTNLIVLDQGGNPIARYDVAVATSGVGAVTLHRGIARVSYNCQPRCERELDPGDGEAVFETLKKQINDKMSLSREGGGGGGPQ